MTEPENMPDDLVYEIAPAVVVGVLDALDRGDAAALRALLAPLHPADIADVLERLHPGARRGAIIAIREQFDPEVLAELDEDLMDEVLEALGTKEVAAALVELDSDDAVDIVKEMDAAGQAEVLDAMSAEDRSLIEQGLGYPEDSAGRLMQREVVTVPEFWNVGQTIDFMRGQADAEAADSIHPDRFYDVFVIDPARRPLGSVPLSSLLRALRKVRVADIMETDLRRVPVEMDQEEVAFLFSQRDLMSAPVVDSGGRLVGAITIDDVVDVIHEEHEEDIMRLGGVREDDFYRAALATARARFSWLLINLGTAVLASLVIGRFQATIEQIVALAVLMPIVASMGGNAGTQTLTVAVRALAAKELTPTNAGRIVGKEVLVGGVNGIGFAVLTGGVAWLWFGEAKIGAVIALAMVVNMVVAALAGITIPLALERTGADPAIASGVFLTTVTDVVGFAVFLGLAAWMLV